MEIDSGLKMEEEDEDPPLAVEIVDSHCKDDVAVGVTVITGFLGAGKSTVTEKNPFYFVLLSLFVFI